jgi:Uma2 family endonuclease
MPFVSWGYTGPTPVKALLKQNVQGLIMEAQKLKTIDELEEALKEDGRLELIDGEIVKRPMARFEHGEVQGNLRVELDGIRRIGNSGGGWWFATEVNVRYNEYNAPCHDIAGWRKERVKQKPSGVVEIAPDWVCEISSPGHVAKDTISILNILQANEVPYYWIIHPEEKALTVYKHVDDAYKVIASIQHQSRVRLEPFTEIEFDLDFVFDQ